MPTILLPVPHRRQLGEFNCLPACASMVLGYWGTQSTEVDLARQLGTTSFLDYWHDDLAHAVVVVGSDDDGLLLNDPAFDVAPQRASIDGFLAAWCEFDYLCATFTKR